MFSAIIVHFFCFVLFFFCTWFIHTKTKFLILYFQGPTINQLLMGRHMDYYKSWGKEARNLGKQLCMIYYPATWVAYKNQI